MNNILASPWFKLAVVVALLVAGRSIYQAGYASGSAAVEAKWEAERAALEKRNQQLTASVAAKEVLLHVQSINFERESTNEKQKIIDDYEQRMAGVRTHTERVYIPVKMPATCNGPGAATATATAGNGDQRAELDEKTVDDLASITRDGDTCVIERNELIKRYNAARSALIELEAQQKLLNK